MRRYAFVIVILGMFAMVLLLNKNPAEINSFEELKNFEVNTRVKVEGRVLQKINLYDEVVLLKLNKNIELICECNESFVNKTVNAVGKVEEYKNKKQIMVLEISVLN